MSSPTPMKSRGTGLSLAMAQAVPPFAVPSSLVRMRPVRPKASSNAFTCASEFWPVLASRTSSTWCGALSSAFAATRFTFRISSIRWSCVGRRPAVSAITTSIPRARRGAERVARGEQHRFFLQLQPVRELADRGGLARPVHAGDHDDEGLHAAGVERFLQRGEQPGDRVAQRRLQRGAVLGFSSPHGGEQRLRRGDAAVGLQQRGLELLVQGLVDALAREQLFDRRVQHIARAREAGLEPRGPGKRCYHESVNPRGKVRIIAGEYRGRRIPVAQKADLRPTPDRVRETLFNWLGQWLDGLACLDLFAGSGALGFEAASRGAARVVMVESDGETCKTLQDFRALVGANAVEVVRGDALEYLARSPAHFDVVFLDPPFRQNLLPAIFR